MPRYTVKDTTTGKTITFDWNDSTPPTDADMEEVFTQARDTSAPSSDHPLSDYKSAPMSLKEVGKQAITNLPSSAVELGKNIITPIVHPVETAKGLGTLATEWPKAVTGQEAPNWQALGDFFKQRYGGVENLKDTLAKDPLGFAADLSTVLGGSGVALKVAGEAGNASKIATVGKALGKASDVTNPVNMATTAIKTPLTIGGKVIPSGATERLYESGLKPSTTLSDTVRSKRIQTALEEGIPVSKSGLQKSKNIIKDLNDEIKTRVADYANATIERDKILSPVEDLKTKYQEGKALPSEAVGTAQDVVNEFKASQPEQIPIGKVQTFKQDLNRTLDEFYKKMNSGQNIHHKEWAEARAALADGMREQLTQILPELKSLNQREGALIELNKSLRQAVNRIDNKNILSLIGSTYATAGGVLGGAKGAVMGILSNYIVNNPKVNSRLAIALYKGKKASIAQKSKFAKPALADYQAGRINDTKQGASND